MDVVKATEMDGEEGQEKTDSNDQDCEQRRQRPEIAAENPVTPGGPENLLGRLHDGPDDGRVTHHQAREPKGPDQITGTPARPPGDRQSDRKCNGVRPARGPAFGVRLRENHGRLAWCPLSTRLATCGNNGKCEV